MEAGKVKCRDVEAIKAEILELENNYCGLSIAEQRKLDQLRSELSDAEWEAML